MVKIVYTSDRLYLANFPAWQMLHTVHMCQQIVIRAFSHTSTCTYAELRFTLSCLCAHTFLYKTGVMSVLPKTMPSPISRDYNGELEHPKTDKADTIPD